MSDIWETLEARIKGKDITIVFPEGEDVRILGAVARHQKDGLIVPILLLSFSAILKRFRPLPKKLASTSTAYRSSIQTIMQNTTTWSLNL